LFLSLGVNPGARLDDGVGELHLFVVFGDDAETVLELKDVVSAKDVVPAHWDLSCLFDVKNASDAA
jgi:hypothetical protein